jgi:hypothetical protein
MFRWNMELAIPFFSTDQMFRWNINLELFRNNIGLAISIDQMFRWNINSELFRRNIWSVAHYR